ncbi:hypothetical protein EW146_g10457, partial [Bondarzewia mesenterica]
AFFFMLALFGFSCLSSLGLFANERILFMRERSNGYYSSFTYFSSKVLFDILPLRIVPPMLFGGIVYGLVGFVPTVPAFWKFFAHARPVQLDDRERHTSHFDCLREHERGELDRNTGHVIQVRLALLVTVFIDVRLTDWHRIYDSLLFTGLLINRSKVRPWLQWLHTISFFHAAFEALAVNELRYLQLKEIQVLFHLFRHPYLLPSSDLFVCFSFQYGVELDVPAATILSLFGLRAQSFWWPNVSLLGIFFLSFTLISYIVLHFYVRERR